MSNTKRILITLTPIDKFYFGGEMGFKRNDKDFDDTFSSYVVKSNYFPQQSSLMGMLRYLVLLSDPTIFDGKRIIKNSGVDKQIGAKSFNVSSDFKEIDFGKIKNIEPCFIQYKSNSNAGWDNLITAPLDYDYEVSFENGQSLRKTIKSHLPIIAGYDAKDGITEKFIGATTCISATELFCPDVRIGINRDFEGATKDDAFYKQTFFRLGEKSKLEIKARFAFHAELADDLILPDKINIHLGGDNSMFMLTVEDSVELNLPNETGKVAKGFSKVMLLSDAYIQPEELDNCIFSMNEIMSFRFLSTTIATNNYTKFKGGEVTRSDKYNLHKKGSVYYFDNDESTNAFITALESKKCFRQIGYNQYKKFKN